ncbi:hypothetical protein PGT21_017103 [Puccinia graminis f. sp. tritici]|uniref:Elongation of fatty acids protein n=1 Tax=Puccinia graminis f. sp. tritici TaxID=56615 RepID=A0A5B0N6L2_PUCGR|nr:hypothetical protein PGT21_006432 [Puccinia graminis f. sp. tritici]KAA1119179.1 hypothetical protein PGT21_017103 [Puccinia graminis f. sp. tritici]KAA1122883.1 hypothetical protein PGTUg99_008405 [Puccinia graminis f. sp. tritici]KAA1133076.1 hypothetical protein PGTUg99_008614 [Puccinia graminis f. sp. tritici]
MEHIRYNISSTEDLLSSYQTPSKYLTRILSDVINHPYPPVPSKLPISQNLFEFTLRPELPFTIVCVYLALIALLNKRQDGKNRMKGPWWKAVLLMHNIILAVYSGWTFLATGPATINYFLRGYQTAGVPGLVHNFCDSSMVLWDDVMARYTYMFYLSKFWEILDTLILIGKGKQASILQEYHHAGAILTVWSGTRYESPAAWLFIVFNSLVHTIMYTYYALSVVHIPVPGVLKRLLTKIQITQFLVGGSLGALTLLLRLPKELGEKFEWQPVLANHPFASDRLGPGFQEDLCLHTPGQMVTVVGGVGYLIPLTGLFVSFYLQAYQRKINQKNRVVEPIEKKASVEKH